MGFGTSHDGAAPGNMNSCDISLEPLGEWEELSPRYGAPPSFGVYAIRMFGGKPVGRLKGASDLIYIGEGDIQARLRAHVNSRSDFEDKGWMLDLIAKHVSRLEVRCFRSDDTKNDETQLLTAYFKEHLELPPANLAIPKTDFAKAFFSVMSLDSDDLEQMLIKVKRPLGSS